MRSLGLQARILLLAAAGIVAISLLGLASEIHIQMSHSQKRMEEQARGIGAALVPTLQTHLIVNDLATIQQTLDSILLHNHFRRLALFDPEAGTVLVEGRPPGPAPPHARSDAPAWFAAVIAAEAPAIRIPISAGEVRYGVLLAEPSTASLERQLWGQIGLSLLYSLVTLLAVLPLVIVTLRGGLRPLRELASSATKFGAGDFTQRAPEASVREIAKTAQAFNSMAGNLQSLLDQLQASNATIRSMNEELERRVRERTADLEVANRELEAFSYSVSHDLRAPLRALDGYSRLIEEEDASALSLEGRAHLERIRANAQKMERLIDDLLALARVSRQELQRVPVDLSVLAEDIRTVIAEHAPERKVDWRIEPGLTAHADPVLAKALLENLLRNAWKFSAERDDAHIELGARQEGGETVFCVRDNGAGFDPAYADKLFKPFQRLHEAKRFEGTGIGLTIVERIVHRHGGRIWAESQPGQGAAFHFTLP
jgi:signal transduction histidine kinase